MPGCGLGPTTLPLPSQDNTANCLRYGHDIAAVDPRYLTGGFPLVPPRRLALCYVFLIPPSPDNNHTGDTLLYSPSLPTSLAFITNLTSCRSASRETQGGVLLLPHVMQ